MTRNLRQILLLFLFLTIGVAFQNCDGSGKLSDIVGSRYQSSGGEGYSGLISLTVPSSVQPGETVYAKINGGSPPYKLTSSSPDVAINPTGAIDTFSLSVAPTATQGTLLLKVEDQSGNTVEKTITITVIPITAMNSDGFDLNVQFANFNLALSDSTAVALAEIWKDLSSFTAALYTFNYQGPSRVEAGPVLSSDLGDPDSIYTFSLNGNFLLTGHAAYPTGAVTLFKLTNGVWEKQIAISPPSDEIDNKSFGGSVSMGDGEFAVGIGAAMTGSPNLVHIYSMNPEGQWNLDKVLDDPNPQMRFVQFGYQVKLRDDKLFVSGIGHYGPGLFGFNGHVDVYTKSAAKWNHTAHLESLETSRELNQFGQSLDYDGQFLAIASPSMGDQNISGVDVYIENSGVWQRIQHLAADGSNDPSVFNSFGSNLSIDKGLLSIVSQGGDPAVYVYKFAPETGIFEPVHKFSRTDFAGGLPMSTSVNNGRVMIGVQNIEMPVVNGVQISKYKAHVYIVDFNSPVH